MVFVPNLAPLFELNVFGDRVPAAGFGWGNGHDGIQYTAAPGDVRYNPITVKIDYQTRERAPQELTFESEGALQTLTFPLTPSWVSVLAICMLFMNAGLHIAALVFYIRISRQFPPAFRPSLSPLAGCLASASIWGLLGWRMLRSYRRYGHLPRQLWLAQSGRTLGHRREGTERQREWPLTSVRRVAVRPVRGVTGKVAAHCVQIRVRRKLFALTVICRSRNRAALDGFLAALIPLVPTSSVVGTIKAEASQQDP